MPRVTIKKSEYKTKDFSKWLVGKMWEMNLKQSDVADLLGVSQQAFSYKLKTSAFTLKDLIIIFQNMPTEDGEIERILK